MSNALLSGLQQAPDTRTQNGAPAHSTTWNACLDLFGQIGSLRKNQDGVLDLFKQALQDNEDVAVRIALWARDVRGGAGERQSYRTILTYLAKSKNQRHVDIAVALVAKTAEVGRWDDLLQVINTKCNAKVEKAAIHMIAGALHDGNALCAKWMPRKGNTAVFLTKTFGMSPRAYRKLLVGLTNVVESKMCAKQWSEIEFGKIPSLAAARYQKAFQRNAPKEYSAYEAALVNGEAKINAGAVFPHDVLYAAIQGNDVISSEQWKALPNYMEETDQKVLAMVDVSGSMMCGMGTGGGSGWGRAHTGPSCMHAAVALGMYCAERNNGPFKDHFITFTDVPRLVKSNPARSLRERWDSARKDVGYNTNIRLAFDLILNTAVKNNVPASDMPSMLLVLSDMQFDSSGYGYNTAHQQLKKNYQAAGYDMPKLVYWNLNAVSGNMPITAHHTGAALVSGYSPAIMSAVLSATKFDPCSIMLDTVMVDRYNWQ